MENTGTSYRQQIEDLSAQNRLQRSDELEQQIANLRIEAAAKYQAPQPKQPWRAPAQSPYTVALDEIPEINAADLDLDALGSAIHFHGALIVRGLVDQKAVDELRQQLDHALDERDQSAQNGSDGNSWYCPPEKLLSHPRCKSFGMTARTGSMWTAASPRVMCTLIDLYERLGLQSLCDSYFGEQSMLSIKKWVLRRIFPLAQPSDWHQDGAFMGADIKSVNLWLALNECGESTDAPGMDIIPGKISEILDTGTHDAAFEWSVGEGLVEETFAERPAQQPHFKPGDAVFFDHMNLHRTSYSTAFTQPRYAIESWFIAPSNYPQGQVPLYW